MKKLVSLILTLFSVIMIFVGCSEETTATKHVPIESTTETTKASTEPSTEPLLTDAEILETGFWVCYSPQDAVFNLYKFVGGIVVDESYSYSDGIVKKYMDDAYMTYEIQGDQIVILNGRGYEQTWKFTDDPDIITYSWQNYYGPEPGPVITQKVYHHQSIPTYEEAVEEEENMWVK